MAKRSFAHVKNLESVRQGEYFATPERVPEASANLISSATDGFAATHMPVIDIDWPCRLVPSRTPGHFHLYIDHEVEAASYFNMLDAMARAGIVQRGYAEASRMHGASFARIQPWQADACTHTDNPTECRSEKEIAEGVNPADVRIGF